MQRLENDRNVWNNQYQAMVKDKEKLIQQIKEYQKTINDLQSKILAQVSIFVSSLYPFIYIQPYLYSN